MNIKKGMLLGATLSLVFAGATQAALLERVGGLAYYDTDLDISWLADANLAASLDFGVAGIAADGAMARLTADQWIGAMNAAGYLGISDWRLPTVLQPDADCSHQYLGNSYGFTCVGSELGHLFYLELGGQAGHSIGAVHNDSYELFSNVQESYYWSSFYTVNPSHAWAFNFGNGELDLHGKTANYYAWAVVDGDIGEIPVPAAAWLLGSALVALRLVRRKTADA